MNLMGRSVSKLIRLYQVTISKFITPSCRFSPSCSEYSKEAFYNYGFFKGCFLTAKRLLRCNPIGGDGYDPIPPRARG